MERNQCSFQLGEEQLERRAATVASVLVSQHFNKGFHPGTAPSGHVRKFFKEFSDLFSF